MGSRRGVIDSPGFFSTFLDFLFHAPYSSGRGVETTLKSRQMTKPRFCEQLRGFIGLHTFTHLCTGQRVNRTSHPAPPPSPLLPPPPRLWMVICVKQPQPSSPAHPRPPLSIVTNWQLAHLRRPALWMVDLLLIVLTHGSALCSTRTLTPPLCERWFMRQLHYDRNVLVDCTYL